MEEQTSVVFCRKLLKKFILLYKELPCLWDKNCVSYKHKKKRHEAISKLTELVQEYDPGATRVHILRKIESLRACVRREYKKVQDSRENATAADDLYTPQLWYYDLFSFVFEDENTSKCNLKTDNESHEDIMQSDEEDESTVVLQEVEDDEHSYDQAIDSYPTESFTVSTSMIEMPDHESKRFANFDEVQNKGVKRHCTEIEDEYDAIGINVAAKLRGLPSNMRILAEKLINDVLFQAQMNGLSSSTILTTAVDPFK